MSSERAPRRRDIRWRKARNERRLWLLVDGEVTPYYSTPGNWYATWPYALYERLPAPPGVWHYRQLRGFRTWEALQDWLQTASLDYLG